MLVVKPKDFEPLGFYFFYFCINVILAKEKSHATEDSSIVRLT
jgi:hypothetical protein